MTSISKNVYSDKSDDIVNKYNNTYHKTIKMKPADVKSSKYIDSSKEINDKDPKFRIDNIVRISKYKNIFATMFQIVLVINKEAFVIKVKNNVLQTYVISDLKGKVIVGTFSKKELQKANQKELRFAKVIKGKDYKLYVKWKGYGISFKSQIDIQSINE